MVSGASSAGLSTTVLPAASAGPSFQEAISVGAFQAVIAPTTPSGSRIVYAWRVRPKAGSGVTQRPSILSAQPAKWRIVSIAFGMSTMRGSKAGLPTSSASSVTKISASRSISVGEAVEQAAAIGAGHARPLAAVDLRARGDRGVDTSAGPAAATVREALLAGRRDHVERRAVGGVAPRAGDEELGRRVRDRPGRDAGFLADAHPILSSRNAVGKISDFILIAASGPTARATSVDHEGSGPSRAGLTPGGRV